MSRLLYPCCSIFTVLAAQGGYVLLLERRHGWKDENKLSVLLRVAYVFQLTSFYLVFQLAFYLVFKEVKL